MWIEKGPVTFEMQILANRRKKRCVLHWEPRLYGKIAEYAKQMLKQKSNYPSTENHMPDKTIFLKISAEVGLSRIQNRSFLDRLDQESITFHDDVFNGYEKIVEKYQTIIEDNA